MCLSVSEEPVMFKYRQQLLNRIQKTRSIMTKGNTHDFNIFSVTGQRCQPTVKRTADLTGYQAGNNTARDKHMKNMKRPSLSHLQ